MNQLTYFLCAFLSVWLTGPLYAQQKGTNPDEKVLKEWMKEQRIPALGIGIIREGQLRFSQVYGELAAGEPAPINTLFNVASLTKPVVTMLTLKLVGEGKWDLDEPLAKYWTDPDVAGDSNAYKLTTRHVLSHQTGFLNWRWLHATKKLTFDFPPGTQYQYSGEGFEYLRKALEKKFGKPLQELCRTLLFQPLGMNDSHFTWDKQVSEARFAKWHDKEGKNTYPTGKPLQPNAADDLMTTVEDYTQFGVAVLNGFGLRKEVWNDMITPGRSTGKRSTMCLGWEHFGGLLLDEYAILHTGSDRGVRTLVLLFPKSKNGLVLFTNSDNGTQLYGKIIEATFGDLGKDFMKKAQ